MPENSSCKTKTDRKIEKATVIARLQEAAERFRTAAETSKERGKKKISKELREIENKTEKLIQKARKSL